MSNITDRLYTNMCSERTLQSDTNGFFLQFVDHVVNLVGLDWLNGKFGKLKTDRERIETIFTDKEIKGIVCHTLANVQCMYRKKDAKISRDKRLDGEAFLKKGNPSKALMLFCQSVLRAPAKGAELLIDAGRSLALSLWDRSQALTEIGELNLALNDLQQALKEGLPDKYKPELYLRMAVCYQGQGEPNRAKVALALAAKLFGKNTEEFNSKKESFKIVKQVQKENRKSLPDISEGQHNEFNNASSLLNLKESADMGRHFVAKKPIAAGDTLIVEPPRAACLLPECFGSHCHNCFHRLVAPVGCPDCCGLAFCSTECRDKALTTYHKYECKILDMLIGSGMSILCHVALRLITQEGLSRSLELYNDKASDNIRSLCAHIAEREPKDFLQRTLMAAFLLRCIQKTEFFNKKAGDTNEMKLSEDEFRIAELILGYLQILQFNAHEIYETRHAAGHRFRTARTAYVGVGIYPTVALFNHDCCPGVIRYFVDRKIVITATRPVNSGEMIAENYGPIFLKKNLAERQRSLLSRYWFKCQCTACKENWPTAETLQNKHAKYRCPTEGCTNLFTQPAREDNFVCSRCKKEVNLKSAIEKLALCEKQYKLGMITLDGQEPQQAITILKEALNLFYSIASPPHKETHLAQEALRTCLADTGNVYQCLIST